MEAKLKPDLMISGNTGIDDLIELFEKGETELYSLGTLVSFFVEAGYGEVLPILLQGVVNQEGVGCDKTNF